MHSTAQVSKSQTVSQLNPWLWCFQIAKVLHSSTFHCVLCFRLQHYSPFPNPPDLRSRCRHPWRGSRRQMLPPFAMRMMNQANRPCQRWIRSFPDMSGETPKKWLWDGFSLQMGFPFTEMVDKKKNGRKNELGMWVRPVLIGINKQSQLV